MLSGLQLINVPHPGKFSSKTSQQGSSLTKDVPTESSKSTNSAGPAPLSTTGAKNSKTDKIKDSVASPIRPAGAATGEASSGTTASTNEDSTSNNGSANKPSEASEEASTKDEWKKVIPSSYVKLKEPSYMKFSST